MSKQVYIPITEYTTEYRYSYYLSFLVRVFFKDVRYTKIQRKDFILQGKDYWFTARALRNIWDKGAYTNKFITVRNDKRNLISLKWKHRFSDMVLTPSISYENIKSITDFKLFITACIAGKPSKESKGRWLANIAIKTGSNYRETASRRVKRAEKLWLEKKKRVCAYNGYLVQLTNVYSFGMVTYIKNKYYNSVTASESKSNKASRIDHKESIWENVLNTRITTKLKYATSEMYRDIFNPIIYW